jgi:hypothetical protein
MWGENVGVRVGDGMNLGVGVCIGVDESILYHSRLCAHSYSYLQMCRGSVSGQLGKVLGNVPRYVRVSFCIFTATCG